MGLRIALKCNNCDNRLLFQTGQGIMDQNLDRVLAYYDEPSQNAIRRALSESDDSTWNHTQMLAMCRINRTVNTVPVFTVSVGGTDRIAAIGCTCGGEHELYDDEELKAGLEHVKCPKCGNDMQYSVTGYWD